MIFSPMIADAREAPSLVDSGLLQNHTIGLRPVIDPSNSKIVRAELAASLLRF